MDPAGPALLALICCAAAALIAAMNAALPYVDENELDQEEERNPVRTRHIRKLLRRFDKGYGEIQMSWALLLTAGFGFCWRAVEGWLTALLPLPRLACMLIALLVYALIALTLARIVPVGVAQHAPGNTLERTAALADRLVDGLSPITRGAWWIGRLLLKPFGIKPGAAGEHVTEGEILQMVDIGEEKGAIETDEKEMIENIFEFNDMNAGDCMVHRKDITAISADSEAQAVLDTISQSGLSRFPVYEGSIDNVVGILTSRDFLINQCKAQPRPWKELIRPAHFVPESVRTDVLLKQMQLRKQHIAIVIDEYGGTGGLITLEDLLEEIVGNIYDEFDPKEEQSITALPDGRWRVSGSTDLETLNEALSIDLPLDMDYDTLGGLVFSHLTEIPADGERPVVECFGLRISVTEVADRRVEWALVEKLATEESEETRG